MPESRPVDLTVRVEITVYGAAIKAARESGVSLSSFVRTALVRSLRDSGHLTTADLERMAGIAAILSP
jgi:hypothetical protein